MLETVDRPATDPTALEHGHDVDHRMCDLDLTQLTMKKVRAMLEAISVLTYWYSWSCRCSSWSSLISELVFPGSFLPNM